MDKLRLRLFQKTDFDAFHALVSDYDVVKMLAMWPYPADPEFTRTRMNTPEAKAGQFVVIEYDGQFAGTIGGIQGGIGYMLARTYWGQGIATWAVREMLGICFKNHSWDKIEAGTWADNPASTAVLRKCGFRKTGDGVKFCKARGCDLHGPDFEITRAEWMKTLS
ncbi:MAG: GNAT family N-acetyltransferase [Paracoccaceae bacterium]